jgi:hypothetical protein
MLLISFIYLIPSFIFNSIIYFPSQFKCPTGRCIPLSWQCDGDADCENGEDEPASCNEDAAIKSCDESYFKCDNNRCVFQNYK